MGSISYDRKAGTATLTNDAGETLTVAIGEEGKASETFLEKPPVPASVTPLQIRKALRHVGLKEAVDAMLANVPEEVAEEWEYATAIDRHNSTLLAAARGLGMSDEQVDDLFRLAASLG